MSTLNLEQRPPENAASAPNRPALRVVTEDPVRAIPGDLGRRMVAVFVDGMISSIAMLPVNVAKIVVFGVKPATAFTSLGEYFASGQFISAVLGMFASFAFVFFYAGWFYKNRGATPGKLLMGLRVVDARDGTFIGYGRAFLRETLGKILFALSMIPLFLGAFLAVFRKDRRCVHDLLMRTQVIRLK